MVLLFKWNLFSSTFTWYYLFSTSESVNKIPKVWPFKWNLLGLFISVDFTKRNLDFLRIGVHGLNTIFISLRRGYAKVFTLALAWKQYENNISIPRNEEYHAVRFRQLSKLLKARNHKASPEHKDISSIFVPDLSKEISSFRELFCLATTEWNSTTLWRNKEDLFVLASLCIKKLKRRELRKSPG